MEISAIEINILCKKVAASINGFFLSSLYSMEDGVLMRLNHATKPEKLVAISSFAIWITTKNLAVAEASRFVSQTRDKIERSEMKSVVQLGNERIARLELQSRKGEIRNIYAEFFARGNLVLTDPAKDEEILEVARPQTFRHRTLVQGEHYVPPPTRGVPLQDLSFEALIEIHKRSLKEIEREKLNCIKWFGRNVGTSRKFVEEIFHRARVEPELRASDLTTSQISSLAIAAQNLKEELEKSELGYVLIPSEQSDLDVDVCSIVPNAWSTYVEKGLVTIRSYPSLAEALDEVQIESVVLGKRKKASSETRAKMGELESAIAKQLSLIEMNDSSGRDLRTLASDLMRSGSLAVDQKTADSLLLLGTVAIDEFSGGKLRFAEEPRSFLSELTALSLASRLFDEAKRLEVSNRRLIEVKADLERQRDALLEQTKSQEERAEKKIVAERREKQWYERYRWFLTSNGDLAIGGRDSTSNSVIINKYMTKDDMVFHADLHGSPFFVLKRKSAVTPIDDAVILELAQATVSFSRAWKDELGSADAYWIQPDQVKKSAPTGEYLPRGSFFIEGKKNFVRHLKVALSIGIALEGKLFEGSDQAAKTEGREQFVVVCGPEKSLSAYCSAIVKIAPGRTKTGEFVKRLKQQLVGKLKSEIERETAKRLSIDDLIRVLPAGGYKFVSEK